MELPVIDMQGCSIVAALIVTACLLVATSIFDILSTGRRRFANFVRDTLYSILCLFQLGIYVCTENYRKLENIRVENIL